MGVDQRPGQSTLIIMQGVRKIARSGSLIVEELFGGKNKRVEVDPAEVEYESGFNGCSIVNDGLVMMTQLQEELQCCLCSETVQWPLLHCRKGHICCSNCRGRTAAESANKPLSTLRTLRWTDSSPSSSFPASIETLVVRRALLCLTNMITSLFVSSDLSSASISVMGVMWSPQQRICFGMIRCVSTVIILIRMFSPTCQTKSRQSGTSASTAESTTFIPRLVIYHPIRP